MHPGADSYFTYTWRLIVLCSILAFCKGLTPCANAQRPQILIHGAATYYSMNGDLRETGITDIGYQWGYRVGVGIGVQAGETVLFESYLQPYLVYGLKGFSATFDGMGIEGIGSTYLHTLEIPFLFNLRFTTTAPVYFYTQAGPYVGLGVFSHQHLHSPLPHKDEIKGEKVNLLTQSKAIKPLELGLQIGAGIEYGGMLFGLGYQFGLLNQSRMAKQTYRNQGGIIQVEYHF